ncbi:MAG TPA: choice-of-anchor D domain-containing protein [Blastocatellia bacterium]|nr:choice-of-anchor D domain-containing protein [Blastocatellia bacterium]
MKPFRYSLFVVFTLTLICALLLPLRFKPQQVTAQTQESTISFPPDLTPYTRPAIPEDKNPVVVSTPTPTPTPRPPGIRRTQIRQLESSAAALCLSTTPLFVRDVVVSNTDPTLNANDTFGDTEPTIAVNPLNPNEVVITAFSGGWGANSPLWHSTNAGATWTKQFSIPSPPGIAAAGCPCDQVVDYGRGNRLSVTFLIGGTGTLNVFTGTTTNPANALSWGWLLMGGVTQATNLTGAGNTDQPWLQVTRNNLAADQDDVYVAYDDFSGGPDMQVSVGHNSNPPSFTPDNQSGTSTGSINPGHRLAVDPRNGTVYSLFQRFNAAGAGGSKNINFMLNRSTDGGNTWTLNGMAGGIAVATADSTQPTAKFGTVNALLGGVDHAAVDPTNGDVYYAYGNRDSGTGNNRLSIRRLTDNGSGGLNIGAENFVTGQVQAALPSVAVTTNGVVGVLYTTFDGTGMSGFPVFTAHLAMSMDQGVTFTDRVLSTFLSVATDNGNSRQRVLGDYQQLKAVGNTFFGVFTGNGVPFGRPFANHDPIFFRVTLDPNIQAPASLAFSDTCVGTSSTQNMMITNNGGADLTITSISSGNPQFAVAAPVGGFPKTISCGASFSFQVNFTPTSTGLKSTNLTVTSNDPDMGSQMVAVSGLARQLQSITCPADVIAITPSPGTTSVVVNYPPPVIVDAACATSVTFSKASGTSFPLGTTTVTITATDAAMNSVSCSFKVTVFDVCMQDDVNGDILRFNSFTGDYQFIRCGPSGFTVMGKAKVTRTICLVTLEDAKLTATLDRCIIAPQNRGSVRFKPNPIAPVFMINDSNITNNTCVCP